MSRIHRLCAIVLIGCLIFTFPGAALGDGESETTAIELTVEQAVDKALDNSNNLKLAGFDIERGEEVRDKAKDGVLYTPAAGSGNTAANTAFAGLVAADIAWAMSKKTEGIKYDTITTSAFQYYTGVLNGQEKVSAAEKALTNAQWQQMVARVGYSVGTVSMSGKVLAEANYSGKEAALAAARASLDDSFQKLNNLIGLNSGDRPVLKDNPGLVLLKIDDLEAEVTRRVSESPSIWLAGKNVELARTNLDLYNWNVSSEPYEAKEIDVNKAEISAADAKQQLRQLVRTLYQSILQMEEQYSGLEQSLKVAEENLRVKQVQFEAGMATKGDIVSAESDLASAKQAMAQLAYQHELYKMYFNKPWTMTGTTSSS